MHGPVVLAFGKWSSYVVAAAFLHGNVGSRQGLLVGRTLSINE